MVRCYRVTKIVRSGHDCTSPFSAISQRYLSSSRCRNLGPSESACRHYAYPNPVPLLLATPFTSHEKNWKCFDLLALGFPKALLKYFQQPDSL